jgi:pycsar effector protein
VDDVPGNGGVQELPPLAAIRPEPENVQQIQPHLDFLYRASQTMDTAVQFADAKVGGVVLILGIGILDLFRHVREFLDARDLSPFWGWVSCIACVIAVIAALATVLQVGRTLFPRRRASSSLYFFGVVASFPSAQDYADKVWFSRERELFDAMAMQAWNLSNIAVEKYSHLRLAYGAALVFAAFWAIARLGLSLAH